MTKPRVQTIKVLAGTDADASHICPRCGKHRPKGGCPHHAARMRAERGDHPHSHDHGPTPHAHHHLLGPEHERGWPQQLAPAAVIQRLIPISSDSAPACEGPQCQNLNVQLEHQRLQQGLVLLSSKEKSFLRYLARTATEDLDPFILSLLLNPVFDQIEKVYGAVDALKRYAAVNPVATGAPCQFEALVDDLERRLRVYLKMTKPQAGVNPELTEIFQEEDFSRSQIVEPLSADG